ncbi:hypothetical protein RFI_21817 [Reticulomyxa filosa]|uniref:Peptidase M16 C-terminal domain-containing protein n=1 Tax=Reticulomyxa filosa TaxID=46433 RepID=X6MNG8_RETFI|nr:hypothetical protein RFI_21817 [Reticulomyxa filosa]|eukprot:ETO15548.1 hypothetical protein RFI_21817 [Reticulomyxa filosa]
MKLAILGQEKLEELAQYAKEKFSEIKNTDRTAPTYSNDVFDFSAFPALYKIVPIKEKRDLLISWPMESCQSYFMERPHALLSFCLGHEGPGSILALLKKLGYATHLSAGLEHNTPQFAMVCIGTKSNALFVISCYFVKI